MSFWNIFQPWKWIPDLLKGIANVFVELVKFVLGAAKDLLTFDFKSLAQRIVKLFNCAVAVPAFITYRTGLELANINNARHSLDEQTKKILDHFFERSLLDSVWLVQNAKFAGDWQAQTLGDTIYWSSDFRSCNKTDLSWLAHEIVHVMQYERMGFLAFACAYGSGLLSKRGYSYEDNPLEVQAFEFQDEIDERLKEVVNDICGVSQKQATRQRSDSWYWLLWN